MKLGKTTPTRDPRTPKFENYVDYGRLYSGFSGPPVRAHWGHGLPYQSLGNDQYGDCVEAGYAHTVQVWSARANGAAFVPTEQETLATYAAITGFDPVTGAHDDGTNMLQAIRYWQSTGLAGQKIDAYATVNPQNDTDAKIAISDYGALYVGLAMPVSAQSQVGGVWSVESGPNARPGSWGGHCVPITGYGPDALWCVTWGAIQTMTWEFYATYCDEAYVLLSHDWIEASGQSPSGLLWGQLQADLANL